MTATSRSLDYLVQGKERYLLYPAAIIASVAGLIVMVFGFSVLVEANQRARILVAGAGIIVYAWFLSLTLVFPMGRKPATRWLIAILNAAGMLGLFLLLPHGLRPFQYLVWIATITLSCIVLGRWQVYLMIAIFTAAVIVLMQPLSFGWEDILIISMTGVLLNETHFRLGTVVARKVQRLEAINRMSRSISSSIEVEKVISLVCASVQQALLADTYYVGFVSGGNIRLELFYDDGDFFPPIEIPVEDTLAGWVIHNRKSLLLRDMPKELSNVGVKARVIGKPRSSLSWMGAPVAVGKRLHGIVAMASYRKNAFDQDDLELLESIAADRIGD